MDVHHNTVVGDDCNDHTCVPQGRWSLDPLHCTVEFTARHMAISKVRGRFTRFDAQVDVGPTLDTTTLTAEVDLSSVKTGNAQRDAHLRGTDFFDVDRSPTMRFTSRRIEPASGSDATGRDRTYRIVGDLALNGVTRELALDVTSLRRVGPSRQRMRGRPPQATDAETSRRPFMLGRSHGSIR